jgi:phosphatidylethanolamine-binding protein (PEBP) family uncharacterized protein
MGGSIPELDWIGVPAGTMYFAITFIDTTLGEDTAFGQHWAAWDIPVAATKIPKALGTTIPAELMGMVQTGKFFPPCAQSLMDGKDDDYEFTLYALAAKLPVGSPTSVAKALTELRKVTPLGTAKLRGHSGLKGE